MYTEYYKLRGLPFRLTPDHRFFCNNGPHKRAEAYLGFGLSQGEGFVVITGEIGTGKTTLINHVLSKLTQSQRITAQLVTTQLEAENMLRMVVSAFGISDNLTNKADRLRAIETFLQDNYRIGQQTLLFVDECQNLPVSALEELRMLSNFQYEDKGLLQICLVGQPQFRQILASDDLEQLRQRVVTTFHLEPLNQEESRQYIEHRLNRVGWRNDPSFSEEAFTLIYKETGGLPRKINTLCNRLLLFGQLEDTHRINEDLVQEVVDELRKEGLPTVADKVQEPVVQQPAVQASVAPDPPVEAPANTTVQGRSASEQVQMATVSDLQIARRLLSIERLLKSQNEKLDEVLKMIHSSTPKVG